MSDAPQTYANHAKFRPGFHFVASPIMFVALIWAVVLLVKDPSQDHIVLVLLTVGATMGLFWARLFALGVQDRLIRLEERLRMERILPEDLRGRIGEFTTEQLIGLRFASDGELPELARRVLNEGIAGRKAVKILVRDWRADHQRI